MTIICGDCLDEMRKMEENSISAIVTDPPYFLTNSSGSGFMGKSWDSISDLSKYLWESSTFVSFVITFLSALRLDRSMDVESIAQLNASTEPSPCESDQRGGALCAQISLSPVKAPRKGFAHLLVITKAEALDWLKELSPAHTKLIEAFGSGEKESALYAIPTLLLTKEVNRIVPRVAFPFLKVDATEVKEIPLTSMDQARLRSAIEAVIGMKSEGSFIGETIGNANIIPSSAQEGKFSAITLSRIEKEEATTWLTSLLCAISAIRESNTIQNYLIGNFFRVVFSEALRVCKPGGYVLAFSGTRTHHKLASAIEGSGWEIRDSIFWCYGSGFPKSHNNFGIRGYGTALKPSHEPIIMAMKPLDGTFKQNAEKWGQAGININESRLSSHSYSQKEWTNRGLSRTFRNTYSHKPSDTLLPKGRWPANVIFDEEAASCIGESSRFFCIVKKDESDCTGVGEKDLKSRVFYCAKASPSERKEGLDCYITVKYDIDKKRNLCLEENMAAVELLKRDIYGLTEHLNIDVFGENITVQFHKDSSSIIKMKIKQIIESKTLNLSTLSPTNEFIRDVENWMEIGSSRAVGAELKKMFQLLITNGKMVSALGVSNAALKMLSIINDEGNWKEKNSTHPTVKPLKLMEYLIKLVMPPKDGILLDPFAGSGTTILAAHKLGISAIGIEKELEYAEIAQERLNHVIKSQQPDLFQYCI